MKNDFDPSTISGTCSECNSITFQYDLKITASYYGKSLCNKCEVELIRGGYWTDERKMQFIKDRENHKHV